MFGSAENEAIILGSDGTAAAIPQGSKNALAQVIVDHIVARL